MFEIRYHTFCYHTTKYKHKAFVTQVWLLLSNPIWNTSSRPFFVPLKRWTPNVKGKSVILTTSEGVIKWSSYKHKQARIGVIFVQENLSPILWASLISVSHILEWKFTEKTFCVFLWQLLFYWDMLSDASMYCEQNHIDISSGLFNSRYIKYWLVRSFQQNNKQQISLTRLLCEGRGFTVDVNRFQPRHLEVYGKQWTSYDWYDDKYDMMT